MSMVSSFLVLNPPEQDEGKPWYAALVDWAFGSGWLTPVIVGLTVAAVLGLVRFLWNKLHPKDERSSPQTKSIDRRRSLTYEGPKFSYGTAKKHHVGPASLPIPSTGSPGTEMNPDPKVETPKVANPKNSDAYEVSKPANAPGEMDNSSKQPRGPISGNIADKSIPDSTPGMPAKFGFVLRDNDSRQYGLKNFGPGNATSVTLEAHDEEYDVLDGHFTRSIPSGQTVPIKLASSAGLGIWKISFDLSWDDGKELGRYREISIPGMGD